MFKKILISLAIVMCVYGMFANRAVSDLSDVSSQIYRLHVLANSDSIEDQDLKLKVRDKVLEYLNSFEVGNKEELENIISQEREEIKRIAKEKIQEEGYDYDVEITSGVYKFPKKAYGEITLPSGEYEGLRVLIGAAEGQNWWCVLYPNLCVVGSTATIPPEGLEELEERITEQQADLIEGKSPLKFRTLELLGKLI